MITVQTTWAFLTGAMFGAIIAGLLLKLRLTQKAAATLQTCKSELAVLEERVRSKDESYDLLHIRTVEMEKDLERMREEAGRAGREKAAAEAETAQLKETSSAMTATT